jgi:hypothetical protein
MDPKTGLYSKAAQLIRSLPQERGTAEQMIAAARKAGLKQAELDNLRELPSGPITRERLAQTFEASLPRLRIDQYGENPSFFTPETRSRINEIGGRLPGATPEERAEFDRLDRMRAAQPNVIEDDDEQPADTEYGGYTMKGGQNYRERLLKLDAKPVVDQAKKHAELVESVKDRVERDVRNYGADHPITQQSRQYLASLEEKGKSLPPSSLAKPVRGEYNSSHWDHPNVLAHIRLVDRQVGEDRDAVRPIAEKLAQYFGLDAKNLASGAASAGVQYGVITPQEAASVSRVMGWRNGYENGRGVGKRLLHVEELQSDWAQEGRDKGFYDLDKPYQVFDWGKEKPLANYATEEEALEHIKSLPADAELSLRNMASTNRPDMPHVAPYVQNTQHWTDLALKNVLREAAMGGYDGIVFTPGQAQADRYGLEKQVDRLEYHPASKAFKAVKNGRNLVEKTVEPKELPSLIGKDMAARLMHPDNALDIGGGDTYHMLTGRDLKMGGEGMRGYYDGIVPKSVMNLARMHDPDIQPAEPMAMSQDSQSYQGFHLPMTDKLRQGILDKGYPAMRRGGRVDEALTLTRRFTKDGKGAMLRLKP